MPNFEKENQTEALIAEMFKLEVKQLMKEVYGVEDLSECSVANYRLFRKTLALNIEALEELEKS